MNGILQLLIIHANKQEQGFDFDQQYSFIYNTEIIQDFSPDTSYEFLVMILYICGYSKFAIDLRIYVWGSSFSKSVVDVVLQS